MSEPIEFFFDFSSPYGYLAQCASKRIEDESGRALVFRPYLMGAVFKETGRAPLKNHPLVWDYAQNDVARSARRSGVPINLPDPFPVITAGACRAFYYIQSTEGDAPARELARQLYEAYFVDGKNISKSDVVIDIVSKGRDSQLIQAALTDERMKLKLREITAEAISRGIFGSPFFIVDSEPFWGHDRIDEVIDWANSGGW